MLIVHKVANISGFGDVKRQNTHAILLELESLTLLLLVTTQFKVLASLERKLELGLALDALETKNDLLGGLGLLVENLLGLTTITALLTVVTTLTLSVKGGLTSLVLSDLVLGVLAARLVGTESSSGLRNVN